MTQPLTKGQPHEKNNKPAHVIRDGSCKITIWRNIKTDGSHWYECVTARTFSDKDVQLKTTHSFSNAEILRTAELLRLNYNWIRNAIAEDSTDEKVGGRLLPSSETKLKPQAK